MLTKMGIEDKLEIILKGPMGKSMGLERFLRL